MTGSLGVFLAADLAGFYLAFALASLAATGLVLHDGTGRARRAAGVYLILAVLGEVCLLFGLMLAGAATPGGSLLVRDAAAALPGSPWRDATLVLLVLGLGLKAGLVPLHVWLPLAHPAAPTPASAVLSGAIVKAGIIGLLRFLPAEAALPDWGMALAVLGFLTAFWGVLVGVTQDNPKTVLAYSTLSQMGLLTAVLGTALAAGGMAEAAPPAALYAAHHALAKGALFLAVGLVAAGGMRRPWPVLLPTAVLALGLGGLPLTGGALAKLAVKAPLGEGLPYLLATASAAATTLLMLHFLRRLATAGREAGAEAEPPAAGLVLPWAVAALAAVVVPWALHLGPGDGDLAAVLQPAALWEALAPVLAGGILALFLRRLGPGHIPAVPGGDLVVLGERVARALAGAPRPAWPEGPPRLLRAWHGRAGALPAAWLAWAEAPLRAWPAAVLALLGLALAAAFLAGA
nr:proton-conducting transporter membrane subunit [Roseicella aerolata]